MKRTDLVVGSIFLALSIFVIVEAKKMPATMPGAGFGPGIMPFWLGVGIFLLSLVLIGQTVRVKQADGGAKAFEMAEVAGVGIMFGALVLYMVLIEFIGFGISTAFLVTFLARRLGKYAVWKCGLLGIIVASLSVYLFRIMLDMPLPTGLLGF